MSGYFSHEYVCARCVDDEGLKAFIEANAESEECSFCGTTASEAIAAPLDAFIEYMERCISPYFDDPANAGLPYESAEGGYQGTTYTTEEMLMELDLNFPNDRSGQLFYYQSQAANRKRICCFFTQFLTHRIFEGKIFNYINMLTVD